MTHPGRRTFMTALAGAPALASSAKSPNDRLRAAVIGLRGRGQSLIQGFHNLAPRNVELAALCDVDQGVLEERAAAYEKRAGRKPAVYGDLRRVLDDKTIDVVGIATPNHWHALAAVWACQAGKDVCVEKPGSHTFFEGKRVMAAAARYGRVVQHGTQNRSSPNIVDAIEKIRAGVIGRVYMARGIAYKGRTPMGRMTADPVPPGLDWDMWLGPAPKVPYSKKRNARPAGISWHQIWEYGNGDIGNQGVHELDIIRWGLGLDGHPSKVASVGGKYLFEGDDVHFPHIHSVLYEWAGRDVVVTFETRAGLTNDEAGMGTTYPFLDGRNAVGVIFLGTEGYLILPDYSSYYTFLGPKREKGPSKAAKDGITDQPHFDNFFQAVRSRKPSDLNAGPEELHKSSALAHFANISWRTGRMLYFDSPSERFTGDEEATKLLAREYRAPYTMPEA